MRQETRFKFNAYLTQLAKLNGISVDDVSKKFTVEPSVTQTLMNTVQASSAFLQMINILPVAEMKGEKIGVGVTGTIASNVTGIESPQHDGHQNVILRATAISQYTGNPRRVERQQFALFCGFQFV